MTIKSIISKAVDYLVDIDSAVLDVDVLLSFVLDVDKEYLFSHSDEDVDSLDEKMFFHYLDRRKAGEPLAYITNEKEFFALNFFVDNRVLIPRPETELLVEKGIDFLESLYEKSSEARRLDILDLGSGSGAICLSIANYFDERALDVLARIEAFDISEDALNVARINASQFGLNDRVDFFQSDLLEAAEDNDSYDLLITNLPYIAEDGDSCDAFVSESSKKYEPNLALFGGSDGLRLYEKLFIELLEKNISVKCLMGEFGCGQLSGMKNLLKKYFSNAHYEFFEDLAGIDRGFVLSF